MKRINDSVARAVTTFVGSMLCAYLFAGLAIYGGLHVDWGNTFQVVQWLSQTFLQLVLLSVIMVGTRLNGEAQEELIVETHTAVMSELAEMQDIHKEIYALAKKMSSRLG